MSDWLLLVVGDCCGPETANAVAAFGDDRIFYVNLADRCGEQSGPNSAGMAAATTDYVAFANHDDIWLPDHLERALAALEASGAEFYCSSAALTVWARDAKTGQGRYGVEAVSPPGRTIDMVYESSPVYFEPVSSWVMRRSLLDKIGPWRPAATMHRTPLEDWMLRLWKAGAPCLFDDVVTVIYCNGEKGRQRKNAEQGPMYEMGDDEPRYWLTLVETEGADRLRARIAKDVAGVKSARPIFAHTFQETDKYWVFEALQNEGTARLCKEFGWDGFTAACRLLKLQPGFRLKGMLKRRTGETLPPATDWKEAISFVKTALEGDTRWQRMCRP